MKKSLQLFTGLVLILCLYACASTQLEDLYSTTVEGPTWQEQYDLGVRYLSEGNYQEAIIAFTAAIEIDPKQAPAYVGRGDAYVKSGETEENLAAAVVDYEKAIELDETSAEAYLGLADVYIRQGDYEKAREILSYAVNIIRDNKKIEDKLSEILSMSYPRTERIERGGGDYVLAEYNESGQLTAYLYFDSSDAPMHKVEYYYDDSGELAHYIWSDIDYQGHSHVREQFYENGQLIKESSIEEDDSQRILQAHETIITYAGTEADIYTHVWGEINLNNDVSATKSFTMVSPDNSVLVTAWWGNSIDDLRIREIHEFGKGSADEIRTIVDYDQSYEEYIGYVSYTYDGAIEADTRTR